MRISGLCLLFLVASCGSDVSPGSGQLDGGFVRDGNGNLCGISSCAPGKSCDRSGAVPNCVCNNQGGDGVAPADCPDDPDHQVGDTTTTCNVAPGCTPESFMTSSSTFFWIRNSANHMYGHNGTEMIRRSKTSGEQASLFNDGVELEGIALSSTHLFYTNGEKIERRNLDGTGLVMIADGQNDPTDIDVDETHAYWTDFGAGTILRKKLDGTGDIETIAENQDSPFGIRVDDTTVFWTTLTSVESAPKAGGTVTTIASGVPDPIVLELDKEFVYWITDTSVQRRQKVGGNVQLLASGLTDGNDLVVEKTRIYFNDLGENTLIRVGKDGSGKENILSEQQDLVGIEFDDKHLYFINGSTVFRCPCVTETN